MDLFQGCYLLPQRHHVAAEGIERRSRQVLAVVDGVNSCERVPLRKNVVDARSPKVLSNRLQWTAEDFRDPAKVRRAARRRGPQIQQRLNTRYSCSTGSRVRDERRRCLVQALAESFVIAEEKGLILLDRPAHGSAKLVSPKWRGIALVEEIRGIQHVIAKKLECRPMPLIGSGLRHNHHLPAGTFAEFRTIRVTLHVEFAHGVHAE